MSLFSLQPITASHHDDYDDNIDETFDNFDNIDDNFDNMTFMMTTNLCKLTPKPFILLAPCVQIIKTLVKVSYFRGVLKN